MESRKLIRKIYSYYPKHLQADFDFCGKQIGELKPETKKILVALDFDVFLYEEAEEFRPDLIITHHPFIFGTRSQVFKKDPVRQETALKLENELHTCIYSFHTCFDTARGGMNDILAGYLGLEKVYAPEKCAYMRIGYLKEKMKREDFIRFALKSLKASYGLGMLYGKEEISKVALVGGGASYDYEVARDEGADIYLSGDASHHVRREIAERHFNYLDLPHEIERAFVPSMTKTLLTIDPSLIIKPLDHEKDASVFVLD
jgi:dinuclear metal center YbgI/SA1388 family protein